MKELIEKIKEGIMAESYEDRAGRSAISVKSALEVIDRLSAEQPKEQPLDKIICFIKQKQEERALLGDFPELDRMKEILDYVEQLAAEQPSANSWIYCSEKMPPVETEVYILAKRKYTSGGFAYICTTAFYEDGTVRENESDWAWEDIDGEWDEDEECYIVPKGWFEYRHYNPDDVYNNAVDDEVIAWQPLPEKSEEE